MCGLFSPHIPRPPPPFYQHPTQPALIPTAPPQHIRIHAAWLFSPGWCCQLAFGILKAATKLRFVLQFCLCFCKGGQSFVSKGLKRQEYRAWIIMIQFFYPYPKSADSTNFCRSTQSCRCAGLLAKRKYALLQQARQASSSFLLDGFLGKGHHSSVHTHTHHPESLQVVLVETVQQRRKYNVGYRSRH